MADNYLITGYWGEPHVTAENDRGINAAMFGTGRFVLPVGEQFNAEYIGNNTIRMYDGKLMDNGAAAGIPVGEYVDLLIANAGQGMNRNDLIVFQYSQDASTLIESGVFTVIQGTETSGTASDPTLTQEDLLSGEAAFDQMALYRVSVSGTTIAAPVKLFSVSADLAHKAPAGLVQKWYDIETDAELTAAIDDLWNNTADFSEGHFALNMRASVGQVFGGIWHITAYRANASYGVIKSVGYNASHPTIMYLNRMQTWSEWEWVNPPMQLGTEYRTTERYKGLPVYIKAAELELSAGGSKYFNIASGITNIVSINGSVYNRVDGVIYPTAKYAGNVLVNAYGNFIWNVTENSMAYLIVKYTK